MNSKEYDFLASEVTELEHLLSEIPTDHVIDRMSLEARLKKVRTELATINPALFPKKVRLTFRGTPVFGSHGIAAEFAASASNHFTDAYAAIVAGIADNLRYMGRIPDKVKNQLILTGTAIGSFGFEYELPTQQPEDEPRQPELALELTHKTEDAMQKLDAMLRTVAAGSDDELSELVEEIHPRAVKKVAAFLKYVSDQDAWCGLDFNNSPFYFSGSEQVRASAARLNEENIKENQESFSGEIIGVLPARRAFEFKLKDQKDILNGKIAPDIENVEILNREYLYKYISITLKTMQVGQGRPRHTLEKLENIKRLEA